MALFTIIGMSPNTNDYSNRPLYDNRDLLCSMHRPRFAHLNYCNCSVVYGVMYKTVK